MKGPWPSHPDSDMSRLGGESKVSMPRSYSDYETDTVCDAIEVRPGNEFIAGSFTTFEVVITLAAELRAGETMALFSPYGFSLPQTDEPTHPGYTHVSTTGKANLSVGPWMRGKRAWDRAVLIAVKDGELVKGDRIHVVFGDPSQGTPGIRTPFQASEGLLLSCHRVKDPPSNYAPLQPQSPKVNVRPSECKAVRGFATPILAKGEEGSFVLVAEDAYGNRATSFAGKAAIRGAEALAGLPESVTFTRADAGRKALPSTGDAS